MAAAQRAERSVANSKTSRHFESKYQELAVLLEVNDYQDIFLSKRNKSNE